MADANRHMSTSEAASRLCGTDLDGIHLDRETNERSDWRFASSHQCNRFISNHNNDEIETNGTQATFLSLIVMLFPTIYMPSCASAAKLCLYV